MAHSHALAIFLVQVILLLASGRLLGEFMQRVGQPAVMGQLLTGVLLGPSVFGALAPELQHIVFPNDPVQKGMLQGLSELGVLLLLLLTGMEADLDAVFRMRRMAFSVSLLGIAIPFACGTIMGEVMPEALLPHSGLRLATALFLGTALSISSVKVVASVVRDMGFLRRRVGRVMISAAILDDTLGWVALAIIASFAIRGRIDVATVIGTVLGMALFLAAAFTAGRRLVIGAIRWSNDRLTIDVPVLTAIIVMTAAFALATEVIGVHTVLGAFVAGLLVGRSPILTGKVEEQLRGVISGLFMPIFFGSAGLSANLAALLEPRMAVFALALVAVACIGKLAGAYVGGIVGGLTLRESTALAWGMNARGSTEIIIATIGLAIGALTQDLYTMIVTMAVITTLIMPPALRWALRRVPMSEEEKTDEERERAAADQFLPHVERILAVVDRSVSGRLAARLIGRLIRAAPKLTTVLDVEQTSEEDMRHAPAHGAKVALEAARPPAGKGVDAARKQAEEPPIEPAAREENIALPKQITEELAKGYDLVLFGMEGEPSRNPRLIAILRAMSGLYQGARGFVVSGEKRSENPSCILLPITGADYSRRAAEIAIALAAAADVRLPVLYVSRAAARTPWYRGGNILPEDRATIDAVHRLAESRGVSIVPRIVTHDRPEEVIIDHARRVGAELIVMGVKERPTDAPSFGPTADAVLSDAPCAVLLLST